MHPLNTQARHGFFAQPYLLAGALSLAALLPAQGEGFRNPPAGAYSLGRAGGRYAQNDDPSTIVHNPANFADFDKPILSVAPGFVYIHIEHESATGVKSETRDPWKMLPAFFASIPVIDQKLAFGVGVTTPYGLSNEWKQEGGFATGGQFDTLTAWYSAMKTINFNPALSYRLNEQFSIGAGLDVHYSELVFRQRIALAPGVFGNAKFKGDGYGFGGNVGATWEPVKGHRIAATYRSPVTVDYDGSTKTDFGVQTGFDTSIKFPTIVSLAYGYDITDKVRVEVSSEWLQFSNFENLTINALGATTVVPEDWRDTFTFGFGGDWDFAEKWTLRAGYQFYMTPVPDSTFSPTIPDANQNVFTVGLRHHWGRHAIEGAYGGIFYEDRHISNAAMPFLDGTYKMTVHLFALSYNFAF
jgi:long-chain fatty acid transport protein